MFLIYGACNLHDVLLYSHKGEVELRAKIKINQRRNVSQSFLGLLLGSYWLCNKSLK